MMITVKHVIGSSTVNQLKNGYKPQKCGVFLSFFSYFCVVCVACFWYNVIEVMMIEDLF